MKFLVYEDWTLEASPRCFYVGKGTLRRVRLLKRNGVHTRIAKELGLRRVIILETDDESEALRLEVAKIAEYHTYVHDEQFAFGANFTMGGDGVTGKRHTPESKARIVAALRNRPVSSETRLKIGRRTAHPVTHMTLDGRVIKVWTSITEAASALGFARTKMSSTIKRGRLYRGFRWEYSSLHGDEVSEPA